MNYFGTSINQSPTVAEMAGEGIADGAFLAVKYDNNGGVVLCSTEGGTAIGLLLPETPKTVAEGESVTVQIKDIGVGKSGAAIAKGAEVMTDSQGRLVPAAAGKFIFGYAMEAAVEAGELIQVDIKRCGYMPGAASAG